MSTKTKVECVGAIALYVSAWATFGAHTMLLITFGAWFFGFLALIVWAICTSNRVPCRSEVETLLAQRYEAQVLQQRALIEEEVAEFYAAVDSYEWDKEKS